MPWSLAENKVVQQAAEAGFHMNDVVNGVGLKKYSKELLDGLHANHPAYTDYVTGQLDRYAKGMGDKLTPEAAKNYLEKTLIPDLTKKIQEAEKAGGNLNDYFKKLNGN